MSGDMPFLTNLAYFLAAFLFVIGLRHMSSPSRARAGIWWAALGMVLALSATLWHPEVSSNHWLILIAMAIGGGWSLLHARQIAMADMPQTIALYNGLGGGAAATLALVELLRISEHDALSNALAIFGGLIGSVALAGSLVAYLKLKGLMQRRHRFANRQIVYVANGAVVLLLGLILAASTTSHPIMLFLFFVFSLLFGITMTLPIAAADLPVLISLYNALTGLAVGFDGYVMGNPAMMVAGALVFAAGTLLTRLMARAVNRSLSEMMYSGFGISTDENTRRARRDHVNHIDAFDAAVSMAFAERVVIAPGYGMAVAQAQHKLRELTQLLQERGVETLFAIHPGAGRMPGHMNVLLAEAGVPYEMITDLSEINSEFSKVDVVLVVGANDIVNPDARTDSSSPLYGMPILDVDKAGSVVVLKRGEGKGYAGVDNSLLYQPKTRALFGDARNSVQDLITAIKSLD